MDWWNWLAVQAAPEYAAAALMVVLAALLVRVNPSSRANLSFGGFLLFRAAIMVFAMFGFFTAHAAETVFWDRFIFLFVAPLLFSAIMFASVYPRPRGPFGTDRRWAAALAAFLGINGVVVFLRPDLVRVYRIAADGALSIVGHGPYIIFGSILFTTYAIIALVFAREYVGLPADSRRRRSLFLATLAFALTFAYDAAGTILGTSPNVTPPNIEVVRDAWFGVAGAVLLVGVLPAAAAVAVVVRNAWRTGTARDLRDAKILVAAVALPVLGHVLLIGREASVAAFIHLGMWRLVFAGLVAYALVRHQLLGLDLTVKRGIRQSTVAAAFVAVFVVGTEVAEALIQEQAGLVVGVAAALGMTMALKPLSDFADRVANAAMPDAQAVDDMTAAERADVYEEALAAAYADGGVTSTERQLLEGMSSALGIDPGEAEAMEERVRAEMEGTAGPGEGDTGPGPPPGGDQ